MNRNKLKIFAVSIGIISLISSVYDLSAIISFMKVSQSNIADIFIGNPLYFYILYSPLSAIGVVISAVGIYHAKKWAQLFANFCFVIFASGFVIVGIGKILPGALDFSVHLAGKGMLFMPKLGIKAFVTLLIVVSAMAALNLKSTRTLFSNNDLSTT